MSLSPAHVRLVQTSFEVVRPIADTAAALFYRRLFELEPRLRPLFTHDLNDQGRKLMTMLTLVVKNLDRPEHLIPAAQQLGARHVRYGVEARHYDVVGQALLWTLGQGLGERFTPDVEEAWAAAYTVLAGVMIEAAAQAVEQADDEGARTGAAVGGGRHRPKGLPGRRNRPSESGGVVFLRRTYRNFAVPYEDAHYRFIGRRSVCYWCRDVCRRSLRRRASRAAATFHDASGRWIPPTSIDACWQPWASACSWGLST